MGRCRSPKKTLSAARWLIAHVGRTAQANATLADDAERKRVEPEPTSAASTGATWLAATLESMHRKSTEVRR